MIIEGNYIGTMLFICQSHEWSKKLSLHCEIVFVRYNTNWNCELCNMLLIIQFCIKLWNKSSLNWYWYWTGTILKWSYAENIARCNYSRWNNDILDCSPYLGKRKRQRPPTRWTYDQTQGWIGQERLRADIDGMPWGRLIFKDRRQDWAFEIWD